MERNEKGVRIWEVSCGIDGTHVWEGDGIICYCHTPKGVDYKDTQRNGRLISAAPDLLDAVECMLKSADCEWENKSMGHDWPEAVSAARLAVLKARGPQ